MDSNDASEYTDERNWIKANPNLGVSVKIKELREALNKALGDPAALNGTLRLRFGVWTSTHEQWMPLDKWDACDQAVDPEELRGRPCYAGMDLSSSDDTTAVVLLFPPYGEDKMWRVLPFFFLPADNIERRVKKDRVPYDRWRDQGLFILTPGTVLDTQFVLEKIRELAEIYSIRALCFDRSFSADIIPQLEATGLTCVQINQGDVAMTPPTKRLMEMVLRKEIATNKHPVLRWHASNVIVRVGATGLLKPDKSKNKEKIDGISALLDALAHGMLQPLEDNADNFGFMIV
jgi:phage terminase large subunit-like protein